MGAGWAAKDFMQYMTGLGRPASGFRIRRMHDSGDYNVAEIAALFNISRPTAYRSLDRTAGLPPLPADTRTAPDIAQYDQLLASAPATEAGES